MHPLAATPPPEFVQELERRHIVPLSVGHVIIATWEPNGPKVFEIIHNLGLELHVIFNKGAVMVLPPGVDKASGLRRALDALKLSPHNTVGIGDAENDHAFLAACECGVAVANALDSVKSHVDLVTDADHGAGVAELIDRVIATDLQELGTRLSRSDLVIGRAEPVRRFASRLRMRGFSLRGRRAEAKQRSRRRCSSSSVMPPGSSVCSIRKGITTSSRMPLHSGVETGVRWSTTRYECWSGHSRTRS
jgi:hypothetical protein